MNVFLFSAVVVIWLVIAGWVIYINIQSVRPP